MSERAEIPIYALAMLGVLIAVITAMTCQPVAPVTVYEGNYAGFRAIICGRTACLTQRKYCMQFAVAPVGQWCVDEYPVLPRGEVSIWRDT